MYKKALEELIKEAARKFFMEHTEYKQVACYKAEIKNEYSMLFFKAKIMVADNDPYLGEYFTVSGFLGFEIECREIRDADNAKLYRVA